MTGDKERGDAAADKWRDTFEKNRRETDASLTRLDVRADMQSFGEVEDSAVIDQRALEAQRRKESERPLGAVLGVAKGMKSDTAKVVLLLGLALIGAVVYVVLKLRGAM